MSYIDNPQNALEAMLNAKHNFGNVQCYLNCEHLKNEELALFYAQQLVRNLEKHLFYLKRENIKL